VFQRLAPGTVSSSSAAGVGGGRPLQSLIMSSSAPPPSSASSSTAPSAAASAASTSSVAYELRDEVRRNEVVASDSLPCGQMMSVADLRRAVFAANDKKLSDRNYTDLDVYPPGSSDVELSVHDRAARPRDSIASVLARATTADDTLIVVARPLPATAGVQGERASHSHHGCLM
jgi:hypothetical protein